MAELELDFRLTRNINAVWIVFYSFFFKKEERKIDVREILGIGLRADWEMNERDVFV